MLDFNKEVVAIGFSLIKPNPALLDTLYSNAQATSLSVFRRSFVSVKRALFQAYLVLLITYYLLLITYYLLLITYLKPLHPKTHTLHTSNVD